MAELIFHSILRGVNLHIPSREWFGHICVLPQLFCTSGPRHIVEPQYSRLLDIYKFKQYTVFSGQISLSVTSPVCFISFLISLLICFCPPEASDSLLGSSHSLTSEAQRGRACGRKLITLSLCPLYTSFRCFALD